MYEQPEYNIYLPPYRASPTLALGICEKSVRRTQIGPVMPRRARSCPMMSHVMDAGRDLFGSPNRNLQILGSTSVVLFVWFLSRPAAPSAGTGIPFLSPSLSVPYCRCEDYPVRSRSTANLPTGPIRRLQSANSEQQSSKLPPSRAAQCDGFRVAPPRRHN